jgi:hypothetical protein
MASPAPALLVLRSQLDQRWPRRNRRSDGILGDARHARRESDHNHGNAIDVTRDDQNGPDLDAMLEAFRRQMVAYPAGRITMMIHRGRITSMAHGHVWRAYRGDNPHSQHAHISIRPASRDDRRSWHVHG